MHMSSSSSMEHASLAGLTTQGQTGPAFFMNHALWVTVELKHGTTLVGRSGDATAPGSDDPGIEPATEPPPGPTVPPRGPPPHDWDAPREVRTAMARMQQLGGAKFEDLRRRDLELLATFMTKHQELMNTEIICDWVPVLQAMGADMANIQTLACLAQQGNAGRIYANALLIKWMNTAVDKKQLDYIAAPLAMQADLRKARKQIDRLPDWHKNWWAWHAGLALGPYWAPGLKHRNADENIRVVVDPRAWDDSDDDAYDDGDWGGGTWRRHWKSTWWFDLDRGFPWSTGSTPHRW